MAAREAIKRLTSIWVLIESPNDPNCDHTKLRLDVKAVAYCELCGGRW